MSNSRTINTLRNTVSGIMGQFLIYLTTFVYRTIFIYVLGKTYLGISGLFTNILMLLSIVELGIGSAINFSLYKPIAEGNIQKIKSLMHFYKRLYRIIAIAVAVLGLSLLPFLDFFIVGSLDISEPLSLIYILYLLNSLVSYISAHKQALIMADQKGYIITVYRNGFLLVRDVLLIIWLLIFNTFLPTLIIQVVTTLLINLFLSRKANKMYPYLRDKNVLSLDLDTKKDLTIKIKSMFLYKIGATIVHGTDNILISKFIGIGSVGMYSNYLLVINSARTLIQYLITALTPSVGNSIALSDRKTVFRIYNSLYFIIFWIYSLFATCFFILLNPFITIWIGEEYLFSQLIVAAIVLNFYLYGIHQHMLIYRNALGLYQYAKSKPIFEAIINLVASIYLLKQFGLVGVILGTTISYITTGLWIEPYVLYKHFLKTGSKEYWIRYIIYISITILNITLMYFIAEFIFDGTLLMFIVLAMLCIIIPNIIIVLVFHNTPEFVDFIKRIKHLVNQMLTKLKSRT
ncbi:lipopolysaccharide biosynthesis protein [Oceanobacillus chungangensis]|uniref:Sugar translocase n=1 Tax=Oceanobacillus chungangensis TaxID=1229152 RepID=A0A3D8PX95_9BACI|nr:sugar translocase [Oceanobacillus chungangensis]RDW20756.1 sugar translocase [Oceanobacillus chungangensis]